MEKRIVLPIVIVILVFVGIALPFSLWAGGDVLTLDEAVQEVLENNPDIQASHYRSAAAKARISQAKALDDPMVGVMFDDVPTSTANVRRSEEIDYRIEQKIPFPGKRFVRGREARFDAQSVEALSQGRVQDILLDLKRTYFDLYRIDRSLEINHENQGLLKQLYESAKTWYASGETSADTPLKAQVELSKLLNEKILLEQERTTHLAHLKAILNRTSHEDVKIPSKVALPTLRASLEEIRSLALEMRPELGAVRAMEKRDKERLTAARQSLIPDFSLGFQYGQRPNAQDTWTGTAMINLPIFFWGKNRGEMREAKASFKATQAEHSSMEVHTEHEIDQSYSAFRAAERLVASYQNAILPQVRTTLHAAQTAYGLKKIDFMTLVDAARTHKDLSMQFYEQEAGLGMRFAELERLVGTSLEGK